MEYSPNQELAIKEIAHQTKTPIDQVKAAVKDKRWVLDNPAFWGLVVKVVQSVKGLS